VVTGVVTGAGGAGLGAADCPEGPGGLAGTDTAVTRLFTTDEEPAVPWGAGVPAAGGELVTA